jgi:predicted phage terminase large subunit-like protein
LYRGIEDAMSDTYNDKVIQWKEATHDSRFESGCARIDIGTRWTINDMIGRNMAENIYDESIVIPAMDANGNSFCEAVMTTEEYIEKKKRTPKDIWLAEYMQEPTDIKGRLFGDLSIIDKAEFDNLLEGQKTQQNPHGYVGAIAYCDVSDEGADYTASAVGLLIGKKIYIADYVFSRDNTDITIPLVASMLDKWKVNYCRVESNSMGAMFGRHLQTLTKTRILPVANQTNKMTRIIMRSAHIINEMVFVKNNNAHSEQFMMNLYSFTKEGKNKHDDAPDCMAGLSIFAESIFKV